METIEAKAIEILVKSPLDHDLVHKVVVRALQIIPCPNETDQFIKENKKLPSLQKFLNRLIDCLNLNNGILMFTMIYLNRLKSKLPTNCRGLPSTRHRILLSCLILSIKFNNDFSLKNHDWMKLTNNLFNLKDINLMERQLLYLLNWNLFISEQDLFVNFNKFLTPIKDNLIQNRRMKQYLLEQKRQQHAEQCQEHIQEPQSPSISSQESTTPYTPHTPYGSDYSPSSRCSSVSTAYTSSPQKDYLDLPTKINPIIELTALTEQYELNKMIESLRV